MSKSLELEAEIACAACDQGQPMILGKADAVLVADMCAMKGEAAAFVRDWKRATVCFRMAVYYYKQAL